MINIEDTVQVENYTFEDTIAVPNVVEILATEDGLVLTTEDDINYIKVNR